MEISALIAKLKKLNVNIRSVDGKLQVDAPKGRLTPDLLDELKSNKAELIQFLETEKKRRRYISLEPVEQKEYYPLSSAQKRMFILNNLEPGNVKYNMQKEIYLGKTIDVAKLTHYFGKIIDKHQSLRTSFEIIGDQPVQRVHREVAFEIEFHDRTNDPEKDQSYNIEGKPQTGFIGDFIRPFDFSLPPLFRVGLVKDRDGKYFLLIDMHHIIGDDASYNILEKEFALLSTGKELPPIPIDYKDYTEWQNSPGQKKLLEKQEKYWCKIFSDEIPILELPADYKRPAVQSAEGAIVSFYLDKREIRILKNLVEKSGTTLFITLLSVLYVFLSKISRREDIVVGIPTAGRRHADLEKVIGMFVNTLAIRNFPVKDKTFDQFLEEVKNSTFEAFENQEYQFEDLVDRLSVRRDVARNPIFDVFFNFLSQAEYGGDAPP